jgi:hypothetical protein
MDEMKWWQGEWAERQKINEAAAELNSLTSVDDALQRQINRLFSLDKDQGRELERLRVLVFTLMDVLVENGVLQDAKLSARVEAAMRALDPPTPEAPSGGPPAQPRTTRCASCGEDVKVEFTFITDRGEVCERCFHGAGDE